MKLEFLKRRYADIRWGYAQIGFFLGLGNFLILVYNFTSAKEFIQFEYFVPIITIIFLIIFTYVGLTFRNKQMALEHDLGFEQAPAQAKVYRMILEQLPRSAETSNYILYLKRIESKKI